MYPMELIGRLALRKSPVYETEKKIPAMFGGYTTVGGENDDFMREPILILAATNTHVIYMGCKQTEEGFRPYGKYKILDSKWVDDEWVDFTTILELINPEYMKLIQSMRKDENNSSNGVKRVNIDIHSDVATYMRSAVFDLLKSDCKHDDDSDEE